METEKSIYERFRHWLHTVIYEADTPEGKLFDLTLLVLILLSVIGVMLESMQGIQSILGRELQVFEWILTAFFTFEYIGRIIAVKRPLKYIFSLYGIIDALALIPGIIDIFYPGMHYLLALRALRLLRIFRILKLVKLVGAGNQLILAVRQSRDKIIVFIYTVVVLSIILGTIMYLVEGPENGFTSIPMSIYWTIVTLTTVGFGDITPNTPFGQFLSSAIMILGYGIIAVPTGMIGAQFLRSEPVHRNTQRCPSCHADYHRNEAKYCYNCGHKLN